MDSGRETQIFYSQDCKPTMSLSCPVEPMWRQCASENREKISRQYKDWPLLRIMLERDNVMNTFILSLTSIGQEKHLKWQNLKLDIQCKMSMRNYKSKSRSKAEVSCKTIWQKMLKWRLTLGESMSQNVSLNHLKVVTHYKWVIFCSKPNGEGEETTEWWPWKQPVKHEQGRLKIIGLIF